MLLDALGQVGDAVDKVTGGRALRGLLGGDYREALSFIPGSDTLGITDPSHAVSGRDLTDKWGLSSPGSGDFGSRATGFAADMLLNPANIAGGVAAFSKAPTILKGVRAGAEALTGLDALQSAGRGVGRFLANESGALKIPWQRAAEESMARFGRADYDTMAKSGADWLASLSPEEKAAALSYGGSGQGAISGVLRKTIDPEDFYPVQLMSGQRLKTAEDVTNKFVPTMDAAIAKSSVPQDLTTYRIGDRWGDLNASNVDQMIGKTVSDPSYVSTTLDPFGRFYGNTANDRKLLFDINVPEGSKAGYLGGNARWSQEKELVLPRDAKLRVRGVEDVPYTEIGHTGYRLDPEGKPYPLMNDMGPLHSPTAGDEFSDYAARFKDPNSVVVPPEMMDPNWQRVMASDRTGGGVQKRVLLDLLQSILGVSLAGGTGYGAYRMSGDRSPLVTAMETQGF